MTSCEHRLTLGYFELGKRSRLSNVARGSVLTVGAYGLSNVLRLLSNLILARMLVPEAFALVALAGIATQGLKMFSDIGIGPGIIRSSRDDDALLNTAWTMQLLRGWVLFLAACALAVPFAQFYGSSSLLWIIPASALPSAISGFNSTSLFTQNRSLRLGTLTVLELAESVVKFIVTLAWSVFDPSVCAILMGVLASRLFYTISGHFFLPIRPHRLQWDRDALRELVVFGSWIFLSTVVTFFAQQSDRLVLGKLITLDLLGVYSVALLFSRLPLDVCSAVAGKVLFPALAAVAREHPERLPEAFRKTRRVLLSLGAASTIAFMVLSPWFFHFGYDARYRAAIWLAPMMGIVSWFSLLQAATDRVLIAVGDTRWLFFSNLSNFVVSALGAVLGFKFSGIVGFIAGYGLGNLAGHLVVMFAVARTGRLRPRQDVGYTALVLSVAAITCWYPAGWSMDIFTHEGQLRAAFQSATALASGVFSAYIIWTSVVRR